MAQYPARPSCPNLVHCGSTHAKLDIKRELPFYCLSFIPKTASYQSSISLFRHASQTAAMAASPDRDIVAAGPTDSSSSTEARPQSTPGSPQSPQPPIQKAQSDDTRPSKSQLNAPSPKSLKPLEDDGPSATPQTAPSTLPFGIEKVQSSTPLPHEEAILAVFGDALRQKEDSSSDDSDNSDIEHVSTAAAIALNMLCPPIDDESKDEKGQDEGTADTAVTMEAFLWSFWTLLLGIARIVPHDTEHPGQATLVAILDQLRQLPRGTVSVWGNSDMQLWRDLPLFVPRWTEGSARPRVIVENTNVSISISDEAIRHWRNQSAFSARCLQAGLTTWYDEAVYALRDALEGKSDSNKVDRDNTLTSAQWCSVLVATEWIVHSGKALFKKAQENDEDYEDLQEMEDDTTNEYDNDVPPGPLFREQVPDARAGLSGARWLFWKERFQKLAQTAGDDGLSEDDRTIVQSAVRSAVDYMERAEKESAEEEEEQLRKWEMEMEEQENERREEEGEASVEVQQA